MRTETKERPILFSGEMVRAILDGRKTQTRRVCKIQPMLANFSDGPMAKGRYPKDWDEEDLAYFVETFCPYGSPGTRLWVRETWADYTEFVSLDPDDMVPLPEGYGCIAYKSDMEVRQYGVTLREPEDWKADRDHKIRWRPSIHMPRWASRLTLEVTDVRVERVQDIGIYDIAAEGLDISGLVAGFEVESDYAPGDSPQDFVDAAREEFQELWDSINAKRGYGWDTNPWVWVVEFKRVEEP